MARAQEEHDAFAQALRDRDVEVLYLTELLTETLESELARNHAITHVGRSGRRVPESLLVGDIAGRALLWLSLPVYLFGSLPIGPQVIAASIMAPMAIAIP